MAIENILKNLNLFVDGRGFAGKVTEIELPKLTMKTSEYRAGGMDAPVEVEMGMEKLETTFTLNGYDPEVLKLFGLAPGNSKSLTLRGTLINQETGVQQPILINLRGMMREVDMGTWKPGEDATLKISVALTYYKLAHNGVVIYEIDPAGMKRIINGVDQLLQTRIHLGVG